MGISGLTFKEPPTEIRTVTTTAQQKTEGKGEVLGLDTTEVKNELAAEVQHGKKGETDPPRCN